MKTKIPSGKPASIAGQNKKILQYLLSGKGLTPIGALTKFGCFRLSARIFDLRRSRPDLFIQSKTIKKNGKKFACYKIAALLVGLACSSSFGSDYYIYQDNRTFNTRETRNVHEQFNRDHEKRMVRFREDQTRHEETMRAMQIQQELRRQTQALEAIEANTR